MSLFGRKEEAYEFEDLDTLDESSRDRHWTIKLVLWVLKLPGRFADTIKRHPRKSVGIAAFLLYSLGMTLRFGFIPTTVEEPVIYPEAPVGTTLTRALQRDIISELDHGAILWGWVANGWTPNDFWPWPRMLYPYRVEFQRGKHLVWKLVTRNMLVFLSQQGRSAVPDENLEVADRDIAYFGNRVFMWPPAESNLTEAAEALGAYADALPKSRRFYAQADTLANLLQDLSYTLNLSVTELSPGRRIGWMQGYAPFQRAQGRIHVIIKILLTLETDFKDVLDSKAGSRVQLHDTIDALKAALGMSPLFICNGEKICFGYSDVAYLNQNLSPGERELSRLIGTIRGSQK